MFNRKSLLLACTISVFTALNAHAHQTCQFFLKWHPDPSMDKARIYQNSETGLLEYTAIGRARTFHFSSIVEKPISDGEISVTIKFGNSPSPFSVLISGASDSGAKRKLSFLVKPGQHLRFSSRVKTKKNVVKISIESKARVNAKIWATVEEAVLCPLE